MHHFRSLALLSLVAVCRATAGCNADNCLRALENTAHPGLVDCLSYFAHTVTPSTTTLTVTATAYSSTSAVQHTTLTSIEDEEATSTVLYTAAETDTITLSVASTVLVKRTSGLITPTTSPTTIPAYASACSSVARYSSACSCAGFTASAITAPTPSTTITVTQTLPTTVTTLVATDTTAIIISITDTTLITSTVGTLTSVATSTEIDITTSTTAVTIPSTTFALFASTYDPTTSDSPVALGYSDGYAFGATSMQNAEAYTLTPEGYLQVVGTTCIAVSLDSQAGGSPVQISDRDDADMLGWTYLTCSIDENLMLNCVAGDQYLMQYFQGEWGISKSNGYGLSPSLLLQVIYF